MLALVEVVVVLLHWSQAELTQTALDFQVGVQVVVLVTMTDKVNQAQHSMPMHKVIGVVIPQLVLQQQAIQVQVAAAQADVDKTQEQLVVLD
jgi:GTP-binding protein EngB required for normal cell division